MSVPPAPNAIPLDTETITLHLGRHPNLTPKKVARKLYPKPSVFKRAWLRFSIKDDLYKRKEPSKEEIERAKTSGKWADDSVGGKKGDGPSELFLKIFADVLLCLDRDPLSGVVSPPLIGSCGTIPLTILSVIPDIMQHYYDCIVLARREVLLATNYLQPSDSQRKICDGLKELSRRVGQRGQKEKVVVKIIYDRGNWRQVYKNHQPVLPGSSGWSDVQLPKLSEIPNLELEVINFHRVLLGTFHAKYMIVDRQMALLNSNNIQDRPNVEMMIHLEGPIVDSFYDMFLISWSNRLRPSLPYLTTPSPRHDPKENPYKFETENPYLASIDVAASARAARATLQQEAEHDLKHAASRSHQSGLAGVIQQVMEERETRRRKSLDDTARGQNYQGGSSGATRFAAVVQQLVEDRRRKSSTAGSPAPPGSAPATVGGLGTGSEAGDENGDAAAAAPSGGELSRAQGQPKARSWPKPSALRNANGDSAPPRLDTPEIDAMQKANEESVKPADQKADGGDQNAKFELHREGSSLKIQTPLEGRPRGDTNSSLTEEEKTKRMRALSSALNAGTLLKASANVSDDHMIDDFRPHTLHSAHAPFPIAMVNRRPHGMPGHQDIRVPQNAAWMAGFRYAKKKVFVQTPTLNASPVVRLCVETAKRGVEVILYLDLGFNDKGESIPFQGGTNQQVVIKMYKQLKAVNKQKFLIVYWYTGKDQIRPINAVLKSRNCHVKFMAVDDHVGIQGNGNQDTQSWFHSQEINVMIDSAQVVGEWMEALVNNQNTRMFGRVHPDGIWRDSEGRTVDYYDKQAVEAKEAKDAAVAERKRAQTEKKKVEARVAKLSSSGRSSSSAGRAAAGKVAKPVGEKAAAKEKVEQAADEEEKKADADEKRADALEAKEHKDEKEGAGIKQQAEADAAPDTATPAAQAPSSAPDEAPAPPASAPEERAGETETTPAPSTEPSAALVADAAKPTTEEGAK